MAQDDDKGKIFFFVCLRCGLALGYSILMKWHTLIRLAVSNVYTLYTSCECVTSKFAPLSWTALSTNNFQQYKFISLIACSHDMRSIDGSWNNSSNPRVVSLLVFHWRRPCCRDERAPPPHLRLLPHFLCGRPPQTVGPHILNENYFCHPSLLWLELSMCIGQCSVQVHSIHTYQEPRWRLKGFVARHTKHFLLPRPHILNSLVRF